MNKLALAIATTVLAVMTIFNSAAEAGMKVKLGFGGPLPYFTAHSNSPSYQVHKHRDRHVRRNRAERSAVAKRTYKVEKATVAKVQEAPKTVKSVAQTEQSSISSADAEVVESADTKRKDKLAKIESDANVADEPKTAEELGCKKFFPSVAMTLTVPCE